MGNDSLDLLQTKALADLYNSKEYQEHLLPHLKSALSNKWLDPLTFPNQEEFQRAYSQYRAKAVVYQELMDYLSRQPKKYETLKKKKAEPKKDYGY